MTTAVKEKSRPKSAIKSIDSTCLLNLPISSIPSSSKSTSIKPLDQFFDRNSSTDKKTQTNAFEESTCNKKPRKIKRDKKISKDHLLKQLELQKVKNAIEMNEFDKS